MINNRLPEFDAVVIKKKKEFILYITKPRGYACTGPGNDKSCPDKAVLVVGGGPSQKCVKCKLVYRRMYRRAKAKQRKIIEYARLQLKQRIPRRAS